MKPNSSLDDPQVTNRIFFPRKDGNPLPGDKKISRHTLEGTDGIRLSSSFHFASKSAPNLLLFHGNGEVATDYDDLRPFFTKILGVNVMIVDFRGYGSSEGIPSISSMIADAPAIFSSYRGFLDRKECAGPILLYGRSLGSASVIEIAANYRNKGHTIQSLIIESGFSRVKPLLQLLGVPADLTKDPEIEQNDNREKVKNVTTPTLVIHGSEDFIINWRHGQELYENVSTDRKKFILIEGAGHNTILMFPAYQDAVRDWIANLKR